MFKYDLSSLCDDFLYIYQSVERFSVWFLVVLQTGIFSSVCSRQLLMNIFGNNILVETWVCKYHSHIFTWNIVPCICLWLLVLFMDLLFSDINLAVANRLRLTWQFTHRELSDISHITFFKSVFLIYYPFCECCLLMNNFFSRENGISL